MIKNKKGETPLSVIVIGAIALIVVLSLIPSIFSNQSVMTDTFTQTYNSYTGPTNTSTTGNVLRGQEIVGAAAIVNESGAAIDCSTNYTVAEQVWAATNTKRVVITHDPSSNVGCEVINISYTAGEEGYVDDAGGRGIANLIGLLSVVAIFAIAIYYMWKNDWLQGLIGK